MKKLKLTDLVRRRSWIIGGLALLVLGVFAPLGLAERSAPPVPSAAAPTNVAPPSVVGAARVGQILRADHGRWQGDTPMTFSYQWRVCEQSSCVDVQGATDAIYAVRTVDRGRALVVAVTARNGGGSASASSNPSEQVIAAAREAAVNTRLPSVAGSLRVGDTITAQPGTWAGLQPIRFGYQWRVCDALGGACSFVATGRTFQLRPSDVGHTFRVLVRAVSGSGGGATVVYLSYALSNATGAVGPTIASPVNTSSPTISGTARQGEMLTARPGSWRGAQPIHFTYQWQRCGHDGGSCANVSGATGQIFRLEREDVGHRLRFSVLAVNRFGFSSAVSDLTNVVEEAPPPPPPSVPGPANTVVPTIGGSAVQGSTLTANPGTWQGAQPISMSYQWDRCDANLNSCPSINGATSRTYTLTSADIGQRLVVRVTAKNVGGTSVAKSAPTAAVQTPPPLPPTTTKFMSVTRVALPSRLVVDNLQFNPDRLTSRSAPFVARFHVSDVNSGRPVAGALVYAVGVPFNRLSAQPEATTGQDGWATITFRVLPTFQLHKGNLLTMFVRARKPGGSLLAGVSTRRLVALRIG